MTDAAKIEPTTSAPTPVGIGAVFDFYAKESAKDGKISLDGIKKWFKTANITGVTNAEFEKSFADPENQGMDLKQFQDGVSSLAKVKDKNAREILDKLVTSGKPDA